MPLPDRTPPPGTHPAGSAVVLVPVQRLEVAKSRLAPLGEDVRQELALAFALDTLSLALAAAGVVQVVAVTDDPVVAASARGLGAVVAPGGPGLNPALHAAGTQARRATGTSRLVALCADLPALSPAALATLLRTPGPRSLVVDHHGAGTTALLDDSGWEPSFGPGSARAHQQVGYVALAGAGPGLRTDVDTPDDLHLATALGLAPRSREVAHRLLR